MDKGFFFTIDSFLALTFISAIILLSLFHMSNVQTNSWNSVDLRVVTNDVLLVLERNGTLDSSFKINSTGDAIITSTGLFVLNDLNKTNESYCFELVIMRDGNVSIPVFHVIKPNCDKSAFEFASIERPLVIIKENLVQNYVVRLIGWRK